MLRSETRFAALVPLLTLASMMIDPIVTTLVPLVAFFIFHKLQRGHERLISLRTADLAFTAQIYILIANFVIGGMVYLQQIASSEAGRLYSLLTFVIIFYLVTMLLYGMVQALRGQMPGYLLSLRLGERFSRFEGSS